MPPPLFRYDYLIPALEKLGIYHLERLSNGHVRWGDQPMASPYYGFSIPTAPLKHEPHATPDRILFDLWAVESILNKFGKKTAEFSRAYFGGGEKPHGEYEEKTNSQ